MVAVVEEEEAVASLPKEVADPVVPEVLEVHVDKGVLEVQVEPVDHLVTLVQTVTQELQVTQEQLEAQDQMVTQAMVAVDPADLEVLVVLVVVLEVQPVTTFIIVHQLHLTIAAQ